MRFYTQACAQKRGTRDGLPRKCLLLWEGRIFPGLEHLGGGYSRGRSTVWKLGLVLAVPWGCRMVMLGLYGCFVVQGSHTQAKSQGIYRS